MGSIWKTSQEARILDVCHKCLEPKGFRVVDLDLRVGGRSLVRIFIERMASEGATVEDCAEVSRVLGPALDEQSEIPGAYDLEISSPGIERRLRLLRDFENVLGADVKLHLRARLEGRGSNITGRLARVDGDHIVLEVQGQELEIPLNSVKLAHRVWQFKP